MVVEVQTKTFQKETTGTNGVTQDVTLNFTPKAIIVLSHGSPNGAGSFSQYHLSIGFSDGTTHASMIIASDDADAAADTITMHPAYVYARVNETSNNTVLEKGSVSFGVNKVTFTWTINSTQATRFIIYAIGGSDILNAKVNTVQVGTTSTGNKDYTGLGFTPVDGNAALFTLASFFTATSDTPANNSALTFGCGVSSSKQWIINNVMEDTADPMDTWSYMSSSYCLGHVTETTGAIDYLAAFVSWISDGFRVNFIDAPSASTLAFSYLVINGGTWDAGVTQSPAAPALDQDYAVSVSSNTLRGILMGGTRLNTLGTVSAHACFSIGTADYTATTAGTCAIGVADEDAQPTSDSYRWFDEGGDGILVSLIPTTGSRTIEAEFDSFSTNNFRLDWQVLDTQTYFGWIVVADQTTAAAAVEDISYQSYGNIHQQFDSNKNAIFG